MRTLDVTHKVIAIVGGLIGIYTFVAKVAPEVQLPPNWLNLLLALALIVLAVSSLIYHRKQPEPAPQPQTTRLVAAPRQQPLSHTESVMLNRAQAELQNLHLGQRVALGLIYREPGKFVGALSRQLTDPPFGFDDPYARILNPLINTSLVSVDGRQNLSPSPHRVIASAVEKFLADAKLL